MKIHPRHVILSQARSRLCVVLSEWMRNNPVTLHEALSLLSQELNTHLQLMVKTEWEETSNHNQG